MLINLRMISHWPLVYFIYWSMQLH